MISQRLYLDDFSSIKLRRLLSMELDEHLDLEHSMKSVTTISAMEKVYADGLGKFWSPHRV